MTNLCPVGKELEEKKELAIERRVTSARVNPGRCAGETFECVNARMDALVHWQTCKECGAAEWRRQRYEEWLVVVKAERPVYESWVYRLFVERGVSTPAELPKSVKDVLEGRVRM